MRTPGSGAPVWSEIEPATSPVDWAAAAAGAHNTASTAAIAAVMLRAASISFRSNRHCRHCDGRLATHRFQTRKVRTPPASRSVCRRFFCASLAGWLVPVRRRATLSPGPAGPVAAIVQPRHLPRDHFTGNFRVDLDQRAGKTRECRPGHRGSVRVCRRARTSGRRLHPIDFRRSSQAGPDYHGRRPRRGLRAHVSAAALS